MEGIHFHNQARRHVYSRGNLGSRIPHKQNEESVHMEVRSSMEAPSSVLDARIPARVFGRAECTSGSTSSECEKPVSVSSLTIPITVAVILSVVIAFGVLLYLHRRATKRHQAEDNDDKYKSLDFGLEEQKTKGGKRKSGLFGGVSVGEKEIRPGHKGQLSMDDMNLSSPYLLPPGLQQSRESLQSLARTLHQNEDPYRHVESYTNSEVGSLRSFQKGHDGGSSIYTRNSSITERDSSRTRSAMGGNPPPRQNSLPTPAQSHQNSLPSSPLAAVPPSIQGPDRSDMPLPVPPAKNEFRFNDDQHVLPRASAVGYSEAPLEMPQVPMIQEPAPVARRGLPPNPRPASDESVYADQPSVAGLVRDRDSSALPAEEFQMRHGAAGGLDIMGAATNTVPANPRLARQNSPPVLSQVGSVHDDYADQLQFNVHDQDEHSEMDRGRVKERRAGNMDPQPVGLGVPQQANKRLSVGFRPLPPDEFLESEDPEFRANRIRSFYKEYFDDSKEERPPMPQPPQRAEYYEDYDQGYLGDATFFDPVSNAFVMPYAEPVTRRAMTPPPNSRRPMPPRPRGPNGPHGPHDPMRGLPMPVGPGGRPRAGSTMSAGRWAGAGSPRPGSSASARPAGPGKRKKPLPPPSTLNTLPTPSKLKDDSFALLGSIEFAPPPTYRDHAAGRSQSPSGERRPYALNVPVASPLASAFDDIPTLPSPHLLRKSATFTALDFAPPRRFKDPDSMSDAGSIRSVGSGISTRNLGAIRNGAGRVSRLPGDQVFTQAVEQDILKPKWDMSR